MVINIVLYQGKSWILGKFANKLADELGILGHIVSVTERPLDDVDVNHHIIYNDVMEMGGGLNTVMVTHIDTWQKWKKIKALESQVNLFICMSAETQSRMLKSGINSKKLSYVNPAHDHDFEFKKIRLGFFSNIYSDNRKSERELVKAILAVDHSCFCIVIMGSGWDGIISSFENFGVQFEWYQEFEKAKYIELINGIDYLVYTGFDEGSMSYLDAVMANKNTIVTTQGFHLDVRNGITHPITCIKKLRGILLLISDNYLNKKSAITELTWSKYATEHIYIWEYLKMSNNQSTNCKECPTSVNRLFIPRLISTALYLFISLRFLLERIKNKVKFLFYRQFSNN